MFIVLKEYEKRVYFVEIYNYLIQIRGNTDFKLNLEKGYY
jgi:hypothetical protein